MQASGRVDAWVACVGTGATFLGTGATFLGVVAALRARNPSIIYAVVEPAGCEPLAGRPVTKPRHLLQGTSYGAVPPHWDAALMDLSVPVMDDNAERWPRLLATREGLHVGYSVAATPAPPHASSRQGGCLATPWQ